MARFLPVALASIVGGSIAFADPAVAKPYIYVTSGTYNGTAIECMNNVKPVLSRLQFGNFESDQSNDKRITKISGYHNDEYVTVEVECDQKLGITAVGVAGLDNKLTFDLYNKVINAKW